MGENSTFNQNLCQNHSLPVEAETFLVCIRAGFVTIHPELQFLKKYFPLILAQEIDSDEGKENQNMPPSETVTCLCVGGWSLAQICPHTSDSGAYNLRLTFILPSLKAHAHTLPSSHYLAGKIMQRQEVQ